MKPRSYLELHKYSGYGSGLFSFESPVKALRIQLPTGITREITHPTLSREFISGVLEDSKTQGFFRSSSIQSLAFLSELENDLPELVHTKKSVGELLLQMHFPTECRVYFRDGERTFQKVRVIGLYRGFLITNPQPGLAIPLAALSALEVGCG